MVHIVTKGMTEVDEFIDAFGDRFFDYAHSPIKSEMLDCIYCQNASS